ncbi:hypothetical protein GLAREA_02739 [Glarea lozoyensis ATCC 20868]|uniref:Uncharacterized protein n=1 Tax=Glarea lozoyensis (strain ATCC 20868 / MF5171) TaxID=1116229 RepID=S3CMA6_GLAL2|nr:uncharacterized protein GLAREA_02739 [Glarea lozoyensis ATCC 20868]EPE26825.1 hypothetical protein GLAREA_02739 [Glarea lozoyensis ATCC 20868]
MANPAPRPQTRQQRKPVPPPNRHNAAPSKQHSFQNDMFSMPSATDFLAVDNTARLKEGRRSRK